MDSVPARADGLLVGLLGPLEISVGGEPTSLPQSAQRVLLAMLAVSANRVVPAETLISALWQEEYSQQRASNLHAQVYQLRRRLGQLEPGSARIITKPPGYRLVLSVGELDTSEFADIIARARSVTRSSPAVASRLFRQALALWRGPALADVTEACPRLRGEAARLGEQRLTVLEERIDAELAVGQHSSLAAELTGLVAEHPQRDRLRGQLMLALYRSGRQADALEAYREGRRVLRDELGLDPSPQLKDLHQRILAGDPRLASPVADVAPGPWLTGWQHENQIAPRQLPSDMRHFAGREAELKALNELLDQSEESGTTVVITAIGGTAGVGKTTLAVHWAHQIASRFTDGQLYVNLRGYDPAGAPVTPAEAIRGFLDGLEVPPERIPASLDAQAGLYRTLTASRSMLILLDNARDPAQVRPLLPGNANSVVIITSRSSLVGLTATDDAHPVPLDLLTDDEARQLLVRRLGPERIALDPGAASRLITLCARLPLALSIIAARAAVAPRLPLAALAAKLHSARDRLDVLDTGDHATSLRAVFSWSCKQLTESGTRMFHLIGIHAVPDITVPAAASLAAMTTQQASRALAELTAAHLIREYVPGRYAVHDLLRTYATEQANAEEHGADHRAANLRALDHYLHTACAADHLLLPGLVPITLDPPQPGVTLNHFASAEQALTWFQADHQVLLAAITLAAGLGFDTHVWQIPWAMAHYLDRLGHVHDWIATHETALGAAGRLGDHVGIGWTHHRLGQACSRLGHYEDATAHHYQALIHFRTSGNLTGLAAAHMGLNFALRFQGRDHEAQHHAQRALGISRQAGDRFTEALSLHMVGWFYVRLGNPDLGLRCCQQALELHRELGDLAGQAEALDNIGYAHCQVGNYDEAITCYEQAISIRGNVGGRSDQAESLIQLGDTHAASGDLQAAREAWRRALDILGDMHHPGAGRIRAELRG
jgi:DNA-binding SARP family transcriptional activator